MKIASGLFSSKSFSNLTQFLLSKLNVPYVEVNYQIKNNDTIEKILKKNQINEKDIKDISQQLKRKKLSNIYSGRKLKLIYKKVVVNFKVTNNLISHLISNLIINLYNLVCFIVATKYIYNSDILIFILAINIFLYLILYSFLKK